MLTEVASIFCWKHHYEHLKYQYVDILLYMYITYVCILYSLQTNCVGKITHYVLMFLGAIGYIFNVPGLMHSVVFLGFCMWYSIVDSKKNRSCKVITYFV